MCKAIPCLGHNSLDGDPAEVQPEEPSSDASKSDDAMRVYLIMVP